MNKIYSLLFVAIALMACHNDNDDDNTVRFPETQVLNCQTGETKTIEFDAQEDWRLTSSQSWCKFVKGSQTLLSASGKAGKQSVTLAISDEGLTQGSNSVAQLTLFMQGQTAILAEVTRSAAGYSLKVYDAEGNETSEISVDYGGYTTFYVEANFPFAATAMPDWAELQGGSMVGAANTRIEAGVRFDTTSEKVTSEQEGMLTFQDRSGNATFSVKIKYSGMSRDAIIINQPGGNAWNWQVSADGQTWTHESNTYSRFIECSIQAYHDDYEVIAIEETEDGKMLIDCEWLHYSKTLGRLTADATDTSRKAYVLAFPHQVYDHIRLNGDNDLFETSDNGQRQIAYKWQQNNLVAHVTQEVSTGSNGDDDSDVGFIALCFDENWEMLWIRCNRVTDNAQIDRCEQMTGCRELYLLNTPSPRGHFDQIRPWPLISDYSQLSGESAYFMDKDGNRMDDETPELSFSDSETPSYWYIMQCHNTTGPMYLVLLDADCKNVTKVLMIDTATQK